jgi:hypothetical protein
MLKSIYIKTIACVFSMIFFQTFVFSQKRIFKYEVLWAFKYPIAACKIKKQWPIIMRHYELVKQSKVLDTLENGGRMDAFRHVYFMAYLINYVKEEKLRKLGIAHEKGNYHQFIRHQLEFSERPDSLACVMDLRNNEVGFELKKALTCFKPDSLAKLVIEHMKQGKAWYLKRNEQKNYVSCENEAINLSLYTNNWFIPKCLIPTNL